MVLHTVKPWSAIVLLSICVVCVVADGADSVRTHEICHSYTGRRIYLESSERGVIRATNYTNTHNKFKIADRITNGSAVFHYQCQLELVTCSACVFHITITDTNFTQSCAANDLQCECDDHITFGEPPYDGKSAERKWCGKLPQTFRSNGRVLVITYAYSGGQQNAFSLTYSTEKNLLVYDGFLSTNATVQQSAFQSPYFPNFYPRDLIIEHLIRCNTTEDIECSIEITFTDFQISASSVMEFYDENKQLLAKYNGEIFRPPIVRSTSPTVLAKFYASGGTGFGYRATINYRAQSPTNHSTNTHCGGLVGSFGGAITMMNMTDSAAKVFDCIWLIKPPNSYLHVKTHLLVRIDTFEEMAGSSLVMVREGLTSVSPLLQSYEWPSAKSPASEQVQSFVTALTTGFYISFRGTFGTKSRLAIVYTAFSYMDCFPGPEFLCGNRRCIPFYLQCDGFDHCGDDTDERDRCAQNEVDDAEPNEYWLNHTPNYFFPKNDHYPDLKTAAVVFLASAMSLVMLILLLIVILYRMNHHVREQRELQSQLRTISELLDNTTSGQNDDNDEVNEQPPAYEHPPDYEAASTTKFDVSPRHLGRAPSGRKRSRSHSRSRSVPNDEDPILDCSVTCTPTPSELLIPELYLENERLPAVEDVIECHVSSSQSDARMPESMNPAPHRNSQVLLIPESPPPEYTPRKLKMLQSAAHALDMDKPTIAGPMEAVHSSTSTPPRSSTLLDGGIFLVVPTDVTANLLGSMPSHSSAGSAPNGSPQGQLGASLFDDIVAESSQTPGICTEPTTHMEQADGFIDIPLPATTQILTEAPPATVHGEVGANCSNFYNRNVLARIERHRFKARVQRSLSENEICFLFACHKMSSSHALPKSNCVRRTLSDSLLSS